MGSVRGATVLLLVFAGCAGEFGPDPSLQLDGSMRADGGGFQNPEQILDAGVPLDAKPNVDAFFAEDPPPLYCGPDGGMSTPPNPGGSVECPADKNREGCPCPEADMTAACWPGKRKNRERGICQDGTTVCRRDEEFGMRWGPCEGYVLPTEGVTAGPEACGCFSSGTWTLSNLSPCIHETAPDAMGATSVYLYSSYLNSEGELACNAVTSLPPDTPEQNWSESGLNVDCEGQFELCFTIKAGDIEDPQQSDCVISRTCVDVWYAEAGQNMPLPPLPGWSSDRSDCARRFLDEGGYGEMSVLGTSIECDAVDDGEGSPFVFQRTNYCPPRCQDDTEDPACENCKIGGSGDF